MPVKVNVVSTNISNCIVADVTAVFILLQQKNTVISINLISSLNENLSKNNKSYVNYYCFKCGLLKKEHTCTK